MRGNSHSREFKAIPKPEFGNFQLKHLAVYSTKLKQRDTRRFDDLKPVLMAEGRRPPPKMKTKGLQAGEYDFDDIQEYNGLGKLNLEFQMVIHDWAMTPIYLILTRDMDVKKALFKCCNKKTLQRLASNLKERRDFEERS